MKKYFLLLVVLVLTIITIPTNFAEANQIREIPELTEISEETGILVEYLKDGYEAYLNTGDDTQLLEEIHKHTDIPPEIIKARWEDYLSNFNDKDVKQSGSEFSYSTDGTSLSSYKYSWNNERKRTSFLFCEYQILARSSASIIIDNIEARSRLYNGSGTLVTSKTDNQNKTNYAGSSAQGKITGGYTCKGSAYANNTWKKKGYETEYHQTKWTMK